MSYFVHFYAVETSFRNITLSLIILWTQIWDNDIIPYTKSQNKYITLRIRVDHQVRLVRNSKDSEEFNKVLWASIE